jgi:hypothetical protein
LLCGSEGRQQDRSVRNRRLIMRGSGLTKF